MFLVSPETPRIYPQSLLTKNRLRWIGNILERSLPAVALKNKQSLAK